MSSGDLQKRRSAAVARGVSSTISSYMDHGTGALMTDVDGREWIAGDEFTAADIMLAGVLRTIRKTDRMKPYPRIQAYYERCFARPAWQRTLRLSAERLGMKVDDIR